MHNIIKQSFNIVITILKGLQLLLVLFALLTMIDFILFLVNVQLPPFIQNVFDTIYNLQSNFYKPDLSVLEVDFTLAVASIVMLIVAGILIYVINFIIEFEKTYDKVHADGCRRFEKKFNTDLKQAVDSIDAQIRQFAIFYSVSVEQKGRINPLSQQPVNLEAKTSEYRAMLKNSMINSFNAACKHTPDGYVLFFENINDCEQIFAKINDFIDKARNNLKKDMLTINLKTVALIAQRTDEPETYLPKMKKLVNIALPNKIIVLSDFKEKYEKMPINNYKISSLGEYSFMDNILDVYSLEPNLQ